MAANAMLSYQQSRMDGAAVAAVFIGIVISCVFVGALVYSLTKCRNITDKKELKETLFGMCFVPTWARALLVIYLSIVIGLQIAAYTKKKQVEDLSVNIKGATAQQLAEIKQKNEEADKMRKTADMVSIPVYIVLIILLICLVIGLASKSGGGLLML